MAVDVGQAAESGGEDWDAIRNRALAAGAVEATVVDARAEMAEDFCVPALLANAKYEGKYPLVSALSRPVIVKHLVAEARRHGAYARRPRLHRQGQRPGPLRGRHPGPGPRPRGARPGPRLGPDPGGLHRVRGQVGHPAHGDQGEAVLDRREPLGQGHRVRGDRGPVEPAARGRVHDDPSRRPPSRPRSSIGFEPGCRWPSTGGPWRPEPLIAELNRVVGSYGYGRLDMVENRRVGIKSRETYECPGALALLMAHADLEDLTLERDLHHEKLRLEPRWAELVYDGLWFSPLKQALDAFFLESQRHVTGEVRLRLDAGPLLGGRPPQPGQPVRLRPRHLRRRRHLPPPGRRGLRAAVGPRAWPPGRRSRGGGAAGPAGEPAMTLWHGRLSGGTADVVMDYSVSLHYDRRLAVDDLVGSRAHVRGLGRGGLLARRGGAVLLGRPRPGGGRARRRARSPSRPTTRTSTPPSSAG